jgi:sialic acid synthase SpsE
MIEKHMTLDPREFTDLVRSIREVSLALGSPLKQPAPSEFKNLAIVRKSLVASQPVRAGEPFTAQNLTASRPGGSLSPPLRYWDLFGTPAACDYTPDQPFAEP